MLIKEYRILLPYELKEYDRGLLYTIARATKEEAITGVPMDIIVNEKFENNLGKGIYTHRIIHVGQRIPEWGRKLLTKTSPGILQVEEKSWNAFPYIKTIYTCPIFAEEKFEILVETMHEQNAGTTKNIHNLPKKICCRKE